jgi:phospholipase C
MGGAAGAAAAASLLARTPAEARAPRRRASLDDVQHVVILMQENRSFDHCYGTMRGVRGFADRTALRDVFRQPDLLRLDGGYLLPFHVDTSTVDGQDLGDLPHDWDTTHLAWHGGRYNQWVLGKSEMTMSYFTEGDVSFHRALASAFTICDHYFCSIQGPTTPNRLYHWTGTIDPDGTAGGPVTANPPDHQPSLHWTTYPERLQAAGVSWQVYANDEQGGDFVGDYGDNPLWLFQAYHDALASSDPAVRQLAERASLRAQWKPDSGLGKSVDHVIAQFAADCAAGSLPAVSWVVAPYGYSEHPAARPVDGEAYVQGVLDAVWGNPELAASTVVLINYDENDGFFDHLAPPVAPDGTPGELLPAVQPIYAGLPPAFGPLVPIGLGPRVPMTVISPWSRGGWVNSQVFDHTSVLRFLETWTGVREPNISAWRRAVCGDLTSCFDFAHPDFSIPSLPDTAALRREADQNESKRPKPSTPPLGQQTVPTQDTGRAPARPLPYQALADLAVVDGEVRIAMSNAGTAAVPLAVYAHHLLSTDVTPHDIAPGGVASTAIDWDFLTHAYDIDVHGPNGFLRHAAGKGAAGVEAALAIAGSGMRLTVSNGTGSGQTVRVAGGAVLSVPAHGSASTDIATDHGWYDVALTLDSHDNWVRRFAGHVENGQPSITG